MTIQAALYDGTDATGTLIATVRVTTQRRLVGLTPSTFKQSGPWQLQIPGRDGGLVMRIVADGHVDTGWLATLYARQAAISRDDYFLACADGDSHQGEFMVEQLDELLPEAEWRTYRLVLLSAGEITYSPA